MYMKMPEYCCTSRARKAQVMTNCPNCGAPIAGPRCEYCGTIFERPDPYVISPEYNLLNNGLSNIQTQLNAANMAMAQSTQTQYILNSLNSWVVEPYIPRPAPLGTTKSR